MRLPLSTPTSSLSAQLREGESNKPKILHGDFDGPLADARSVALNRILPPAFTGAEQMMTILRDADARRDPSVAAKQVVDRTECAGRRVPVIRGSKPRKRLDKMLGRCAELFRLVGARTIKYVVDRRCSHHRRLEQFPECARRLDGSLQEIY